MMIMQKNTSKRSKRVIFCILVIISVIVGFLLWMNYKGSTNEILAAADKFKPGSSWSLARESITPPANFCVYSCPEVSRTWNLPIEVTRSQFEDIAAINGQKLEVYVCFTNDEDTTGQTITGCRTRGMIDGFEYSVDYFDGDDAGAPPTVSMQVLQ